MNAQKILSKLTGSTTSDKALLISSILKFGRNEKNNEEIKKLGQKLYSIIIEGGLNGAQEINKNWLLEKADTYLQGDRVKSAIELLIVLDSQENWVFMDNKKPIYYFNNHIEAKRFAQKNEKTDFVWSPSIKNDIIRMLAVAQIANGDYKEAEATINFYKKINPVSFSVFILESKLVKEKNLEKFKEILTQAFVYAYSKDQYALLYKELAFYYTQKADLESAHNLLALAYAYSDSIEVEKEYRRFLNNAKASGIKLKTLKDEEIPEKVSSLGYPLRITGEMFDALCEGYMEYLKHDPLPEGKMFFKEILLSITGSDTLAFDLEDAAKEN